MLYTLKVVGWLVRTVDKTVPTSQVLDSFKPLISFLNKIFKTRGLNESISYIKRLRLSLIYYLSGEYPLKVVSGIRLSKEGYPKLLKPFFKIIKTMDVPKQVICLRALLTLLFCTRALTLKANPDIESITNPVKGSIDITQYARNFWRKELGYSSKEGSSHVPRVVKFRKFHFTTKAGPNGHALLTSHIDLRLLELDENQVLREAIYVVGGEKLMTHMVNVYDKIDCINSVLKQRAGSTLRKLSYFPDKEGKTRVIGILDYYSQACLFPLHTFLMRLLRKIPQDCSYEQGSFVDKIKDWNEFYSIDLTAATDRFPIRIIGDVLKGFLPHTYVDNWITVMTWHPFDFLTNNKLVKVYYKAGNPMGAYSSWPSFTLAHHYVMYKCCIDLGIEWKTSKYVMLGDDVLIGDHNLAVAYKEAIQYIGVEFSPSKSHESKHLAEFAKRYIWKGYELTPFPISALKECSSKFYFLLPLLFQENRRMWNFVTEVPEIIGSFYQEVLGFNSIYSKRITELSFVCEQLMLLISGKISASDGINAITRRLSLPLRPLPNDVSNDIISEKITELFIDSMQAARKPGQVLGKLSQALSDEFIRDYLKPDILAQYSKLSSIPIIDVTKSIKGLHAKLRASGYHIDSIQASDWPLFLKTVAVPMSDKVFSERQIQTLARASGLLSFVLLRQLVMFCRYKGYGNLTIEGWIPDESYTPQLMKRKKYSS